MGSWGFIGLAYGLAALVLVVYAAMLRSRLRTAGEEMAALEREDGRRAR